MSENYDNWERLVVAVLRRQHDREIALSHSRNPSTISSTTSSSSFDHSFSTASQFDQSLVVPPKRTEIPMDYADLTLDHSVWKTMMPPDKQEVVWKSASLSFFVDKRTRKNCFLLGATKLELSSGYVERCWEMKHHPKSRFTEVAVLRDSSVCDIQARAEASSKSWLRHCIQVSINAKMLSPETTYAAYLVFGSERKSTKQQTVKSKLILSYNTESVVNEYSSMVQLKAGGNVRADKWMEIQLGEFYVGVGDNREVGVHLMGNEFGLGSIIVEGIEFRPLRGKKKSSLLDYSLVEYSDLMLNHKEWKMMLPPYKKVVLKSASLSFFLNQKTGENCFLVGAKNLRLTSIEGRRWDLKPHPKSRFSEVIIIELVDSWEVDIEGWIKANMLTPKTLYIAYLVFEFDDKYPKPQSATTLTTTFNNGHSLNSWQQRHSVRFKAGNPRADNWLEIQLGPVYVSGEDINGDAKVEMMIDGSEAGGIIIEGIEFRPLELRKNGGERNTFKLKDFLI